MSGAPHNRFSDDIRMSAMSAVLVRGVKVKVAAAQHNVDPKTLRTWLMGKRLVYEKSPRANILSGVPQRRCIGHGAFTADGRCPAMFYPESRFHYLCPTCRTKSGGMDV